MKRTALLLLLAACPAKTKPTDRHAGSGSAVTVTVASDASSELPPAAPLPVPPTSLPPPPANARVTADAVAFGELLFWDPRLSANGQRSCATCHDPAHGYSGGVEAAADGKPNARRAPALVNLAWVSELGWDGRAKSVAELLPAHMKGQLDALDASAARIASVPVYAQHVARVGGAPADAIIQALEAYVLTRYNGDAPWDAQERTANKNGKDAVVTGYKLFTGKGQCATCHTPPLYTDNAYHRVIDSANGDKGRGLVDPAQAGAFRTPTVRGSLDRTRFYHDGSGNNEELVLDHGGGTLSGEEKLYVLKFLSQLTNPTRVERKVSLP